MLDDFAVSQAQFSGPISCCGGGLGWYQDWFSTTPQLWRSISGTGLTGAWLPPVDQDDGSINIGVGNHPIPYPGVFQMLANALGGSASGMQVNGLPVSALQMNAAYLNFDLIGKAGAANLINSTPPDPTPLLLHMVGSYDVDRNFTNFGSIWASGPGGGQFRFQIDSLTVAAVPEPQAWAKAWSCVRSSPSTSSSFLLSTTRQATPAERRRSQSLLVPEPTSAPSNSSP